MISKRSVKGVVCAFVAAVAATAAPLAHAGTYLGSVKAPGTSWGAGWNACRAAYKNTNYIQKGASSTTRSGTQTTWLCYKN